MYEYSILNEVYLYARLSCKKTFDDQSISFYHQNIFNTVTEIAENVIKFLSIYGSISYFGEIKSYQPTQVISSNNPLEFFLEENKTKYCLYLQLTKVVGTFPEITDKKIHVFFIVQIGKKMEPIDMLIVCGQQHFELHDQLNPIEIKITDDTFINRVKKYKRAKYKFILLGLLFPATIQNDKNQIFVMCRYLNKAKTALINGKRLNILGVTNLQKNK